MDSKESSTPQDILLSEKANPQQDVKNLWDRWDNAQKGEAPSELVKGSNLAGVIMIIAGALFQALGSGFLKFPLAPIVIFVGASILIVKKFRTLWSQRSFNS